MLRYVEINRKAAAHKRPYPLRTAFILHSACEAISTSSDIILNPSKLPKYGASVKNLYSLLLISPSKLLNYGASVTTLI